MIGPTKVDVLVEGNIDRERQRAEQHDPAGAPAATEADEHLEPECGDRAHEQEGHRDGREQERDLECPAWVGRKRKNEGAQADQQQVEWRRPVNDEAVGRIAADDKIRIEAEIAQLDPVAVHPAVAVRERKWRSKAVPAEHQGDNREEGADQNGRKQAWPRHRHLLGRDGEENLGARGSAWKPCPSRATGTHLLHDRILEGPHQWDMSA